MDIDLMDSWLCVNIIFWESGSYSQVADKPHPRISGKFFLRSNLQVGYSFPLMSFMSIFAA